VAGLIEKVVALSQDGDFSDRVKHRVSTFMDIRSAPCTIGSVHPSGMLREVLSKIGIEPSSNSEALAQIEGHVDRKSRELREGLPFGEFHNASATLGRLCYVLCQSLRPAAVVETGVAYGVTSTYTLQALADNCRGKLTSIDLPPLAQRGRDYVGYFVPNEFRGRWDLHLGSARKLLPGILRAHAPIDIFIHDSLHTYSHMKWELEAALGALRPGGVIIADDIEGNRAFEETARHPSIEAWFAMEQEGKTSVCGVMRKKLG
jgi:predicted O-methyltransferase YrrM